MNVATLLSKAARAYSSSCALSWGEQAMTYAQFNADASRLGSGLLAAGLAPGDRVAICMRNRIEYPVALFGVIRAGLIAVPINAKLHPREVAWIVDNSGAQVLITDSSELGAPSVVRVDRDWAGFLAGARPDLDDMDTAPDDLAWLFFTSGTTGFPKGAMLSHRNLLAMTMSALADVYSFGPCDVVLHPAPLSHGCGLYLIASVARGSRNIIHRAENFNAGEVLSLIESERITSVAFMAPTHIVRLLDVDDAFDTSSLRCIIYGGAPIHSDDAHAAVRRFGPILCQVYGQGEAPMTISHLAGHEHIDRMIASAGRPRTSVEIKIVEGEVLVRGDVVMSGYWQNPDATAIALRDSWLHTGDLGHIDDDGVLFLHDRKGDVIISGGTNIYPTEVENVLVQHPNVHEACVFGVPNREWGETVVAAVVPNADVALDPAEIRAFCAEHIATFKKPRDFVIKDGLPRNAYGKVLRRQLRDDYLGSINRG